jgi:hypothetical protein
MTWVLAIGLALAGIGAGAHGVRLLARGWRHAAEDAGSLWVARGLRGVVVGVGALSLAGGLVFEQRGLLAFGAVFLAEELYETAVLILVVRAGVRGRSASPATRVGV